MMNIEALTLADMALDEGGVEHLASVNWESDMIKAVLACESSDVSRSSSVRERKPWMDQAEAVRLFPTSVDELAAQMVGSFKL
jgi:hypothetical protein